MSITIAAVQAEARPGELAHNVATSASWIRRAAEAGADVVVFAEAFLTGYDTAVFAGPLPSLNDDSWLDPIRSVVLETGIVALTNTALAGEGGRTTLTNLLVDPSGVRAVYDKQHLYDAERVYFSAGEAGASVVVNDAELALSICYDANFPEHAAAAAESSALAYVNSGAYFPGGEHRRDLHHAARALDNGFYVVFAGLIGTPHDFIGGTAIYDPFGRAVVRLGEEEGMAVAVLDSDLVEQARAEQRMWADRRSSLGQRRITYAGP